MVCEIRFATAEDATAISRVVIAALRTSNSQDYPPNVIAEVETSFSPQAVLDLLERRRVFVALLNGAIAGTASLDDKVVRSVFVDPSCQGQGLGKRLMDTLHAEAVDAGIDTLRVPASVTAEGFYARLGYQTIREVIHGAERTLVMEKQLPDALSRASTRGS